MLYAIREQGTSATTAHQSATIARKRTEEQTYTTCETRAANARFLTVAHSIRSGAGVVVSVSSRLTAIAVAATLMNVPLSQARRRGCDEGKESDDLHGLESEVS